ncbi:glutathione S-transferase [Albimonas pacifica]|uniref:Glutathione S-transferase n=1 Tax=Albimonas pacifica TaxID=1114924 RepID=A0A1I3LSM4_9RHOB|nr:glutathione S-transferase [Albimonas pacifica]SFI87749.1 glutathione S-transferase [Albimonas pacifica]
MELSIIDRRYSSWSLRAWLAIELVGAPCTVRAAPKGSEAFARLREDNFPALTVPVLRFDDGAMAWESLSIIEELATRFSDAGLWPEAPAARAAARSLAGEMHAGFQALRAACPMNLERRYAGFEPSVAVLEDVARIETLWTWAAERFGGEGPWLFGPRPCAADLMFAPVITRFVTYGLGESEVTARLQETLYAWGPFRRWRAMGVAEKRRIEEYEMDLPEARRFGPAPRVARAAPPEATAVNAACPYSGRPVAADSLAEIEGRVIGFCNPFCRDKSVADADAWPKLAPLLA